MVWEKTFSQVIIMNYNIERGELGEIIEIKSHGSMNHSNWYWLLKRWTAAVGGTVEVLNLDLNICHIRLTYKLLHRLVGNWY